MRTRIMDSLEWLENGPMGFGACEYINQFYDWMSFDDAPYPNSAMSAEEADAIARMCRLMNQMCEETPGDVTDEDLIRTGWLGRIQSEARETLAVFLKRGIFSDDAEEAEPSFEAGQARARSGKRTNFILEQGLLFIDANPVSRALSQKASAWRAGVPMHWMRDWATEFPIYVNNAKGAVLTDVDGHDYDDFCLGDTPSMFGHARPELAAAIADQAAQGVGFMLPTETANDVGTLLAQRFGLPVWQVATTASDANRAAIRWARAVTGRSKILVFDGCYHGMVDDCFVALYHGRPANKKGLIGQIRDQTETTAVVPFNDIPALQAVLRTGEIAAVLAEPVMTNCGMILPQPGFHRALRDLTAQYGTLLILDETHTLSSGPAGYTGEHGLQPDMLVIGKAIAGGVPAAVWGVTAGLDARMTAAQAAAGPGSSGIGTTLSGNALAMRAMQVMLTEIMTADTYARMLEGADRLVKGLRAVIDHHDLPWSVVHVGARAELIFSATPPHDAAAMRGVLDDSLVKAFHLFLINRGILIAPFHNMMLISPQTSDDAIDRLVAATERFATHFRALS